jgi:hypothetical protein
MHIVKIKVVDPEPLHRPRQGFADVGGAVVEEARAVVPAADRELGRQRHFASAPRILGQELADHLFAKPVAIDVGGVPEIDAEFERPSQRPHRYGLAGRPVEAAEAHGAEADGRHGPVSPNAPPHR